MYTTQDHFSAATQANAEAYVAASDSFTRHAFSGVTEIVELNLKAARSSFEESIAHTKQLLAAKDPQEFFTLNTAQIQPGAEKFLAYGRALAGIASTTHAELSKLFEAQFADSSHKVIDFIDSVGKNAPAGIEPMFSAVKVAIGNANIGYEQLSKAAKEAVEVLEANANQVVDQVLQTSGKIKIRAKK